MTGHRVWLAAVAVATACSVQGAKAIAGDVGSGVQVRVDSGRVINNAATQSYLVIVRAALGAIDRNKDAADNAIGHLVTTVSRHCPGVAAQAPLSAATFQIQATISEELAIAEAHADARIASRFAESVKKLRWHDARAARAARETMRAVSTQSRLREPQLCVSLQQWARGGFRALPRDLARFADRVESLSERGSLLPTAIARYESLNDLRNVREIEQLQEIVRGDLRARILRARAQIVSIVGLVHSSARDGFANPL